MNEKQDKITIIIPVFNTAPELLELCVGSVTGQTYGNLEIILVDDGSTREDTGRYLECLEHGEMRIRVIRQSNQGVSAARKKGVDAATGAFLMFVDSDDVLHEKTCEYLYRLIRKYDCDLAEGAGMEVKDIADCNRREQQENCGETLIEGQEELLNLLVESCEQPLGWAAWGKLYRTDQMKRAYVAHPDIYRGEDVLTVAEYLLESKNAVVSDRKLYYYNKGNPNSATAQKNSKNLTLCKYGYELLKLYEGHGSEQARKHVRAMYCEILFGCILLCEYQGDVQYRSAKREMRKELARYLGDIVTNPFVHNRWKIMLALLCPKLFYVQHIIRQGSH